jgi:hypothetical protein
MRFTGTRKIAVCALVILSLGIASMLVIYAGLNEVWTALNELAQKREPASAAAHRLEIQVHAFSASILRYLAGDRDARDEMWVYDARFTQVHRQYLQLTGTEQGQRPEQAIGLRYAELKALGEALMGKRDRQELLANTIVENFSQMDETLSDHLQPLSAPTGSTVTDLIMSRNKTEPVPMALMSSTVRVAVASIRAVWMLSSSVWPLSILNRSSSYRSCPKACTSGAAVRISPRHEAIVPSLRRCRYSRTLILRYR